MGPSINSNWNDPAIHCGFFSNKVRICVVARILASIRIAVLVASSFYYSTCSGSSMVSISAGDTKLLVAWPVNSFPNVCWHSFFAAPPHFYIFTDHISI